MSDPFRTAARACPQCGVGLREHGSRLVCDACGGILFEIEDLRRAIDAITPPAVTLGSGTPSERRCPRCDRALAITDLRLDGTRHRVLHCERDGVWVSESQLPRLVHRELKGSGADKVGETSNPADRVGLFRKRPRPEVPDGATAHVSPHATATCPTCARPLAPEGPRWVCGACAGVFVENEPLATMMTAMKNAPWSLPEAGGAAGARGCPICAGRMAPETIEEVAIDRCADHGVWFDGGELSAFLTGTAAKKQGLLARLFRS